MFGQDPFSGHVVIRTADPASPGARYRLWTTLKVPQGYSLAKHADFLKATVGAEHYRLMPANRLFALGVGHIRRQGLSIGSKADVPADVLDTQIVQLSDLDWQVLTTLKREFDRRRDHPRPVALPRRRGRGAAGDVPTKSPAP